MKLKQITYKIKTFVLLALIMQSCASYETIKIQVLKPAQIKVPTEIYKLVLINHGVQKDTSWKFNAKELKANNDSILTSEYFNGLSEILQNSPRFEVVNQTPYYIEKTGRMFESLDWLTIDELCKKNNADAALVLENFQLLYSDQLPLKYEAGYLHGELQIINNSIWKIYKPSNMAVPEDFLLNDTLFWDGYGSNYDQVVRQLPPIKNALFQSCSYAGHKYGERIAQTWETENRYIINSTNKDFKKAFDLTVENNWEEAMEIWKKYSEKKHSWLTSFAAYNIAVGYEVLDNLDASLEWAAKSYFLNTTNEYIDIYIKTLEKRKKEKDLIESQFK